MYTHIMMLVSVVFMSFICSGTTTTSHTGNENSEGKYLNYLRLFDGQCFNCSTYKCTNHKSNMGGSEWCIMLFPDAIKHCDSDPNCGGYTMTTADWFHKQYDKNGQVAVHLTKLGEKPFNCSLSQWSSYEKQHTTRDTPLIYGRSTCSSHQSDNFNYIFESNSKATHEDDTYLCQNYSQNLGDKNLNCILLINDGITYCNSDDECEGFMINTDKEWQKKYSKNGLQAVQLFGKGVNHTPNEMWRSFKKQY